jgi:hypothetical protein
VLQDAEHCRLATLRSVTILHEQAEALQRLMTTIGAAVSVLDVEILVGKRGSPT